MVDTQLKTRDWLVVVGRSSLGTLFCIMVAIVADLEDLQTLKGRLWYESLREDIWIPFVLAFPFFVYYIWKNRQLAMVKQALEVLVQTDSLIGCLNRRAFTSKVNEKLAQLSETGSETSALMLIDIDHFKKVNDTVGHEQGDEALKLIGKAIQQYTGEDLIFGRIGGEEFGVFVSKVDASVAYLTAEKIRMIVANIEFNPRGSAWPLSVSIGVSFGNGKIDFQELYQQADVGLYDAKHAGRDRVVVRPIGIKLTEVAA